MHLIEPVLSTSSTKFFVTANFRGLNWEEPKYFAVFNSLLQKLLSKECVKIFNKIRSVVWLKKKYLHFYLNLKYLNLKIHFFKNIAEIKLLDVTILQIFFFNLRTYLLGKVYILKQTIYFIRISVYLVTRQKKLNILNM